MSKPTINARLEHVTRQPSRDRRLADRRKRENTRLKNEIRGLKSDKDYANRQLEATPKILMSARDVLERAVNRYVSILNTELAVERRTGSADPVNYGLGTAGLRSRKFITDAIELEIRTAQALLTSKYRIGSGVVSPAMVDPSLLAAITQPQAQTKSVDGCSAPTTLSGLNFGSQFGRKE